MCRVNIMSSTVIMIYLVIWIFSLKNQTNLLISDDCFEGRALCRVFSTVLLRTHPAPGNFRCWFQFHFSEISGVNSNFLKFYALIPLLLFKNCMWWFHFHSSKISCGDSNFTFLKYQVLIPFVWKFCSSKISSGDSTFILPNFHAVIPLSPFWNFMWWCHFHFSEIFCVHVTFTFPKFYVVIPLFWNLMCLCQFHFSEISCGDSTFTLTEFHVVIMKFLVVIPLWLFRNLMLCFNFHFSKISCGDSTFTCSEI